MSMLGTTHTTMLFYATASTFSSNSRTVLPSIKNGNSRHYGKVLEASLCIIVKVIVLLLKVMQGLRGITNVRCWQFGFISLGICEVGLF